MMHDILKRVVLPVSLIWFILCIVGWVLYSAISDFSFTLAGFIKAIGIFVACATIQTLMIVLFEWWFNKDVQKERGSEDG